MHWANRCIHSLLKDRAHLSTFEFFILEKFSCIVVLIVFFVIVQSSGLISVWFRQKMTFFINFISFHIFAIYVGGACWGLPAACRLIAVSGARLPSVDGLTVRYIKNAPLLNLPSKYVCDLISNLFSIHVRAIQTYRDYAPVPTGKHIKISYNKWLLYFLEFWTCHNEQHYLKIIHIFINTQQIFMFNVSI